MRAFCIGEIVQVKERPNPHPPMYVSSIESGYNDKPRYNLSAISDDKLYGWASGDVLVSTGKFVSGKEPQFLADLSSTYEDALAGAEIMEELCRSTPSKGD